MKPLNVTEVRQTAIVLSNAAVLASSVVLSLSDKNIARSLNSESLTRDRIEQLVMTKITSSLSKKV